MTAQSDKGNKPADKPEAAEPEADETIRFSVERLRADGLAFTGVPNHVIAGALAGEPDDAEFSADEVRERVRKWENTPATTSQED